MPFVLREGGALLPPNVSCLPAGPWALWGPVRPAGELAEEGGQVSAAAMPAALGVPGQCSRPGGSSIPACGVSVPPGTSTSRWS